MAILLADTLKKTDAREIYNDPGGRGLAISARIHNRPTIIIAYHADSHSDEEQRDGFLALKSALPHDPTCDYIWLMDRNNIPNETLDYKHAQGAPNSIQRPEASYTMLRASATIASAVAISTISSWFRGL